MTGRQIRKYWVEWSKCRTALIHHGRSPQAADKERHDLHLRALGYDKSSKEFTNLEFDYILATFRSWSMPDDLGAQLKQIDQPSIRCRYVADQYLDQIGEVFDKQRDAYLDGLALRMTKKLASKMNQSDWSKVLAALKFQAHRTQKRQQRALANDPNAVTT